MVLRHSLYYYLREQLTRTAEGQGLVGLWQTTFAQVNFWELQNKYDSVKMHDKWTISDPLSLFVLARLFSPTFKSCLRGP